MKLINEKHSSSFAKNLKKIMMEKNITQAQLAEKFAQNGINITQSAISAWFKKGKLPRDEKFDVLCKILNVTENDLIPNNIDFPDLYPVTPYHFPILGTIACGTPTETFEDTGDTFIVSDKPINADYALIARGDSMVNFGIKDGYFVFIKRTNNCFINNAIMAVSIDGETTLKKVHIDYEHQMTTLIPGNEKYQPIFLTNKDLENVRCLGRAVFFQGLI